MTDIETMECKYVCITQYIILKYQILNFNSIVLPSSKEYISQYTPQGIYELIIYEINEGIRLFTNYASQCTMG